jgi:hypothetical protein
VTSPDLTEFVSGKPDKSERYKSERDNARRERDRALQTVEDLQRRYDLVTAIDALAPSSDLWKLPKAKKGVHRGIANTISSDQHFGEIVRPQEVQDSNAYSIAIAQMRWKLHVEKFLSISKDHLGYLTYDGAHLWWNGDAFSGDIHEELAKSNELSTLATFDAMIEPVVSGIRTMAAEFPRLVVSVRRGNHTRTSRKTPAKGRVRESFDWLFMRVVERELRGVENIVFDIPESDDGIVAQYDHRFLATHGDQFRGGSGISGIMTPLALGNYKKMRRNVSIGDHLGYDTMILGHFHQYLVIPGVIVNGSLKGYDEYAYVSNFGYEEAQQAFWVTTPEYGPSFHTGIRVQDREREKW